MNPRGTGDQRRIGPDDDTSRNFAPRDGLLPTSLSTRTRSRAVMVTVALVAVLIVAAALRLVGLDKEGFWGDEYLQTQLYRLPLHYTCWFALTKQWFGPLDFVIGWLAYRVQPSAWMCRLPSALWGIVSVAACFYLGRRLAHGFFTFGEPGGSVESNRVPKSGGVGNTSGLATQYSLAAGFAGLVAASLLAVCQLHLVISQDARPYSICQALLVLTLVMFLRAFEKPTVRRVVAYAAVAYAATLTRTFTPSVALLVTGIVLTVSIVWHRVSSSRAPVQDRLVLDEIRAVRRLWIGTLVAGLVAMPMMLFLRQLVHASTHNGIVLDPNLYGIDPSFAGKLVTYPGIVGRVIVENFGWPVCVFAVVGVLMVVVRWRRLALGSRCVCAILLGVGPVVLLIHAAISGHLPLYDRYLFFLMPIVGIFAALGMTACVVWVHRLARHDSVGRGVVVAGMLAVAFAHPLIAARDEVTTYRHRDWRGCARYLGGRITPDDVIMVLSDAPFGRSQVRFFGKYEWPEGKRPLAEAMWSLAISDPHYKRLIKQTGRVLAVIAYPVDRAPRDDFRQRGLRAVPEGLELVKFRGLDVVIPRGETGSMERQVVALCDSLVSLPLEYDSGVIIPMSLKSRVLAQLGDMDEARRCFASARRLIPPIQREYFEAATHRWDEFLDATRVSAVDR